MATRPKSISIHELSSAVNKAVESVKIKPTPESGPWIYINPGVLCGLIYNGPLVEANPIANSIAKQVSQHLGTTVAPVVQESGVDAHVAKLALPHKPVILGYQHESFVNLQ
jgi:hypothetical protein